MKIFRSVAPVLALAAAIACTPAAAPKNSTRATARAAVSVAKIAYVAVGNACLDMADTNVPMAMKCSETFEPAYKLLMAAGQAVDTNWNDQAACNLVQAVKMITDAAQTLGAAKGDVATVVADANTLATAMLGTASCNADAGQ